LCRTEQFPSRRNGRRLFLLFFFRDPNGYVFEVVDADREPEM
jgi:hypothetical protein